MHKELKNCQLFFWFNSLCRPHRCPMHAMSGQLGTLPSAAALPKMGPADDPPFGS
jgi:hypothetical protein